MNQLPIVHRFPMPFHRPIATSGELVNGYWKVGTRKAEIGDHRLGAPSDTYLAHGLGIMEIRALAVIEVPGYPSKRVIQESLFINPDGEEFKSKSLKVRSLSSFTRAGKGYSRPYYIDLGGRYWGWCTPHFAFQGFKDEDDVSNEYPLWHPISSYLDDLPISGNRFESIYSCNGVEAAWDAVTNKLEAEVKDFNWSGRYRVPQKQ